MAEMDPNQPPTPQLDHNGVPVSLLDQLADVNANPPARSTVTSLKIDQIPPHQIGEHFLSACQQKDETIIENLLKHPRLMNGNWFWESYPAFKSQEASLNIHDRVLIWGLHQLVQKKSYPQFDWLFQTFLTGKHYRYMFLFFLTRKNMMALSLILKYYDIIERDIPVIAIFREVMVINCLQRKLTPFLSRRLFIYATRNRNHVIAGWLYDHRKEIVTDPWRARGIDRNGEAIKQD